MNLSTSPCELQKLWPTLVHVHIVLDTLHPGGTEHWSGMYIIKVCLKSLITFASGFRGVCKMSFVTLLNFVSHLILPNKILSLIILPQ